MAKQQQIKETGQPHKAKQPAVIKHETVQAPKSEPLSALLQRAQIDPYGVTPVEAMRLQHAVGNQGMGELGGNANNNPGSQTIAQASLHHILQRTSNDISHTAGCTCAACVQRHAMPDEAVQAKSDTAHEQGCNCPSCTSSQQETPLQRHPEENLLQAKRQITSATTAPKAPVHLSTHPGTAIQRHAAFEHYLLGQVAPQKLSGIPMVRQIPELRKERDRLLEIKKKYRVEPTKLAGTEAQLAEAQARLNEVRHTIEQEMDRLEQWKDNPEALSHRAGEKGKVSKGADDTWNVPIIVLPVSGGEIVVSYSEMNTMPDLFGNPEAIAATPKENVLGILQGVRQQSYIELDNLYKELFGASRSVLHEKVWGVDTGIEADFQGAVGPRAQAVVDKAYEIRTEKQVNTATTRSGEEYEQYFAALERNACHFAPESWSQWEGYHQKARNLAQESATQKALADQLTGVDEEKAQAAREAAATFANQALIQNSFGEHYLQDSFASGHLIDKTKIMQWFMTWLNKNNDGLGTFDKAQGEWAMISTLSNQNLQSNPQRLHDKMVRNELGSVEDATGELGLEAKPEIVFLMWWRDAAAKDSDLEDMNATTAAAKFNLRGQYKLKTNKLKAQQILDALANQGFADKGMLNFMRSEPLYTIKDIHVDALKGEGAYDPNLARNMQKSEKEHGTERDFVKEAHEFNLAAYNAFMSNAYVQASTKFFHDKFCREGLEVQARNGDQIGKIYGDNRMLASGGQAGVRYSAATSAMSREAIFNLIDGDRGAVPDIAAISGRFPGSVLVNGRATSLVNWNENLRQQGEAGLFQQAKDNGALMVYKAQGGISDKGALDMAQLTKNVGQFTPHDETPF